MILIVRQTKRAPKPQYSILSATNGDSVGTVESIKDEMLNMLLNYSISGRIGRMVLGEKEEGASSLKEENAKSLKEKLREAFTFKVYEQKTLLGRIYGEIKDIKKFGIFGYGYPYYKIDTESELYCAYEYGEGRKGGHYWSMYRENLLVGMIERVQITHNTYDNYVIYCEEPEVAFWLIMLSIQIDNLKYSNYTNQMGPLKTKEVYDSRLMPKELKDKYDNRYIDRIKQAEHTIQSMEL